MNSPNLKSPADLLQSVMEAIEKGLVPAQTKIGSDDLLPILIFALVQASPRCIYSNAELLQICQHFTSFGSMDSEISFHAANLKAAADFILQSDLLNWKQFRLADKSLSFSCQATEPLHIQHWSSAGGISYGRWPGTARAAGNKQTSRQKGSACKPSDSLNSPGKLGKEAAVMRFVRASLTHFDSLLPQQTQKLSSRSLDTRTSSLNSFSALRDEEEEMQLGEFLMALKSEDLPTSSGRGLPF
eukprot:757002-Hanusia_phi.AAC.3